MNIFRFRRNGSWAFAWERTNVTFSGRDESQLPAPRPPLDRLRAIEPILFLLEPRKVVVASLHPRRKGLTASDRLPRFPVNEQPLGPRPLLLGGVCVLQQSQIG